MHMEKITFLLVDDDPTSNLITTFNIRKKLPQASIHSFRGAPQALEYIDRNQKDLAMEVVYLLTDWNMPGMSGFEFLEQLGKRHPKILSHFNIYVLSACDKDVEKKEAVANGVQGNLIKPLDQATLETLLDRFQDAPSGNAN